VRAAAPVRFDDHPRRQLAIPKDQAQNVRAGGQVRHIEPAAEGARRNEPALLDEQIPLDVAEEHPQLTGTTHRHFECQPIRDGVRGDPH
jgi:hypothetical protein